MTELQYRLTDDEEIEAAFAWLNKYWKAKRCIIAQRYLMMPFHLEEYRGETKAIAGGIDLIGLLKSEILSLRV